MKPLRVLVYLIITCIAGSSVVVAQETPGGVPYSSLHPLVGEVPTIVLGSAEPPAPPDTLHPLECTPSDAGTWNLLPSGDRVWRLRLESPGASWLLVTFARFQLSGDATLYLHDDDRTELIGAYTRADNRLDGSLHVLPVRGDAVTLELHLPAAVRGRAGLALSGLLVGSTPLLSQTTPKRRGKASPCHKDVACPEGEAWGVEVRAIVKIEGIRNCTGVLLNNTSGDGTPYILTAHHCGDLGFSRFWFHWKRTECGTAGSESGYVSVQRSIQVVEDALNDFQLIRLYETPAPEMNVVYAGWDRSGELPTGVTCLHHPAGGEMKISIDRDEIKRQKQYWKIPHWDVGITEQGSSGAPLFDAEHRVIGQLKGGPATCKKPEGDLFGRLQVGWEKLRPFLDPTDEGVTQLDAMDRAGVAFGFEVTGSATFAIEGVGYRLLVKGSGFSPSTRAFMDDERIPGRQLEHLSNSRLQIELPGIARGLHMLALEEGDERCEVPFMLP